MKNKKFLALLAIMSMVVGTVAMPAMNVSAASYQVKKGDTLAAIARRNGVTVADLCRINGITNPNRIRVGQRLMLSQEGGLTVSPRVTMSTGERRNVRELFNASYYAQTNPDVVAVFGSSEEMLFRHFCEYGLAEGRQPNADFNVFAYKSAYPDLQNAFGDDMVSYYTHYYRYVVNGGENRTLTTVKAAMDQGVVVTTFSGEKCAETADGRVVVGAEAEQVYKPAPSRPVVNPNPGTPVVPADPEYPILTDENGNVYDLGGMEIIVRDWWTSEEQWNQMANEPETAYEMARAEYWQWIQDTYNFKIKREQISDWGSVPQDFVDYATNPADDKNYVFTVREDDAIISACYNGLVYDLSTLDCLDFSETKFTQNRLHEQWTFGDKIYAMHAGVSEPRTGVFFNTELLEAVNIKADDLYQWQTNGEWTWDKWLEVMNAVQRDTNNDGAIDIYGTTQDSGAMIEALVYSNGGEFIGKENGKFVLKLEEQNTVDGLEFAVKILSDYTLPYPEEAQWDYYKEAFKSGQAAFMPEGAYNITGMAKDWEFEYGYLMIPKGPNATNNDYTNCWSTNPALIPANYDAERAWKIAFAWNLFTDPIPGYEDYDPQIEEYMKATTDPRVAEITCAMQTKKGMVAHAGMVPNINMGPDLLWGITAGTVVSEKIDAIKGTWQEYIDAANNK